MLLGKCECMVARQSFSSFDPPKMETCFLSGTNPIVIRQGHLHKGWERVGIRVELLRWRDSGFREAVPFLAPWYGMTVEEFTHQGVNPGYEGFMPAEDCAAGFAYVIVNAHEYHGQIADPFAPLMKFGLLPVTSHVGLESGRESALDQPAVAGLVVEKLSYSKALECAAELEKVLETVNKEFNELGSFAKRWGLRDFQQKAGLSVKDWIQTAKDVVTKLQSLSRLLDSGDVREAYQLRAQLLSLKPMLERLANLRQH